MRRAALSLARQSAGWELGPQKSDKASVTLRDAAFRPSGICITIAAVPQFTTKPHSLAFQLERLGDFQAGDDAQKQGARIGWKLLCELAAEML